MHSEVQGPVVLGFRAETIVSSRDNQALGELFSRIDDIRRFEVTRFPPVDVEYLEGILDDSLQIHWQVARITGICTREDKLPAEVDDLRRAG
jgi:hypothetical protein